MTPDGWARATGLCIAALLLSAGLTRLAIGYARRRGMLDQPGFRRSHTLPTPRGGGVGLVVASLAVSVVALGLWPGGERASSVAALGMGGLLVAYAGWADDHHGLGVLPRLVLQLLASGLLVGVLVVQSRAGWIWLPVGILLATWSINLHNFMDGIDAILGLQLLFVGAATGVLAFHLQQGGVGMAAFGMAAAAAGFLWFNWPPARIFMGDVGSGFAGFLVFALLALLVSHVRLALWPALILCSGFAADAGLTLAWRMWRGKRWYSAHREHLYQWLARSGCGHMRTGFVYTAWNVLLAAPLAALAVAHPTLAPWLCVMLYGMAACAWWQGRRVCRVRVRKKGVGHAA